MERILDMTLTADWDIMHQFKKKKKNILARAMGV